MNRTIFRLQNLTLAGTSEPRLNCISLHINDGATAIVGLSGAGKTSLLNVLAGFETTFAGKLTSQLTTTVATQESRLPLFWVPQSGGLWPHLTVEQHLSTVADTPGPRQKNETDFGRFAESTDEILDQFDLTHRRRALPADLSQGERSRLSLGRALITRARVLLLDEPLDHVDPVRKAGYWTVVRRIVAKENISMIFTSHEPETVLQQAENVICLDAGRVAFQGPVSELYEHPPNAQLGAFLGPLNWFSTDEAALYFSDRPQSPIDFALRPEKLRIHATDDSDIELVSQFHCGAYSNSVVRSVSAGRERSVMHQVPDDVLTAGQRVMFRVSGIQERIRE